MQMHKRLVLNLICSILCFVNIAICISAQEPTQTPQASSSSLTPISDEMIGFKYGRMHLKKHSSNKDYAFSSAFPIPVGGGISKSSSKNTYRFLNTLLGPNGQKVHYRRTSTYYQFRTDHSPSGDSALIDVYEINYEGAIKPVQLYFNLSVSGEILIPLGFTAAN